MSAAFFVGAMTEARWQAIAAFVAAEFFPFGDLAST